MRRAIAFGLLWAAPIWAQAPLAPSAALESKLAVLEERRDAIEARRDRAWNLRISAGVGYGLCSVGVAWALIQGVALASLKPTTPLSGLPYTPPVPLAVIVVAAVLLGATALTLHIASGAVGSRADAEEEALNDEEQPVRKQISQAKDVPAEEPVRVEPEPP